MSAFSFSPSMDTDPKEGLQHLHPIRGKANQERARKAHDKAMMYRNAKEVLCEELGHEARKIPGERGVFLCVRCRRKVCPV